MKPKQDLPQLKILGSQVPLGQSSNASRPWRPSRSDPFRPTHPTPTPGAALNGSVVVTDSYLGPLPSVFLHFFWEIVLDPLSGDLPLLDYHSAL